MATKKVKVRDLKPKKDAKGGRGNVPLDQHGKHHGPSYDQGKHKGGGNQQH